MNPESFQISTWDILIFVAFVVTVVSIGLYQSRSEKGSEDYFLAGRDLKWWLIGFSLIASNISTEQFVGMSGKAADWLWMAIASYEWMAAITLVIVGFLFLPKFLKSGIYTIPEFLEYRYNTFARTVMAIATLIILVGVPTASVIYSGAKVITGNFQGATLGPLDFDHIRIHRFLPQLAVRTSQIDQVRSMSHRMGNAGGVQSLPKPLDIRIIDRFRPPLVIVFRKDLHHVHAEPRRSLHGPIIPARNRHVGTKQRHRLISAHGRLSLFERKCLA